MKLADDLIRKDKPLEYADLVVVGLGFVGLPLALGYAKAGLRVIGVDINSRLIGELQNGRTALIEDLNGQSIAEILMECQESGMFTASSNLAASLRGCRSVIVTVGMPVHENQVLQTPLISAINQLKDCLEPESLVLLRSTVIPGTTEEVVRPLLESTGRVLGRDFYLAYSPERIAEGNAFEEFASMPTLVAGCDKESGRRAANLLSVIVQAQVIEIEQVKAAELSKVLENVQRDADIAIAQVFARVCEAMELNSTEIIALANTHKRVRILTPGPGVGGYCVPNAFHYLAARARQLDVDLGLLELARETNEQVPTVIANLVTKLLAEKNGTTGAKVAVIGLAMKDYSSDIRLSPAVVICEALQKAGHDVWAYDPVVPFCLAYQHEDLRECLSGATAVLLLAKQYTVVLPTARDLKLLMGQNPIVIDTRNWFNDSTANDNGIRVWKI